MIYGELKRKLRRLGAGQMLTKPKIYLSAHGEPVEPSFDKLRTSGGRH